MGNAIEGSTGTMGASEWLEEYLFELFHVDVELTAQLGFRMGESGNL